MLKYYVLILNRRQKLVPLVSFCVYRHARLTLRSWRADYHTSARSFLSQVYRVDIITLYQHLRVHYIARDFEIRYNVTS